MIKMVPDVDSFFCFCVYSRDLNCAVRHLTDKINLCVSHTAMTERSRRLSYPPLRKLTEIISSVHFSQVLPCSAGRNYHYKLPLPLQKRHTFDYFSTRRLG